MERFPSKTRSTRMALPEPRRLFISLKRAFTLSQRRYSNHLKNSSLKATGIRTIMWLANRVSSCSISSCTTSNLDEKYPYSTSISQGEMPQYRKTARAIDCVAKCQLYMASVATVAQ